MTDVLGRTLPRLWTPPLPGRQVGAGCIEGCTCGLTPETSLGFEVIEWADEHDLRDPDGKPVQLRPYQRWLYVHALELDDYAKHLRFRTILTLIARQNGKTLAKSVLSLWRMYAKNQRYLVGTAQDLSLAWEIVTETLVPMMESSPELRARFNPDAEVTDERVGMLHQTLNDRFFRLDSRYRRGRAIGPHGPRYLIKALNRKAGRGLAGVTEVNIDELREQWDFEGWSAISNVVLAAEDAQIWCMSNAGDAKSVLLRHLRGLALAGTEPWLFIAEWSAPDGCDMEDPDALAQANPSLGYGLTMDSLLAAIRGNPLARMENLCQFVDVITTAVDPDAWAAGSDPMGALPDGPATLCLAAGPGGRVVAVGCAKTTGDRWRLELVGSWESIDAARVALSELEVKPAATGWFPKGPAAPLGEAMRKLEATPIKGEKVAEAHMTFADYVEARRILHAGDPLLDAHAKRTGIVGSEVSWTFDVTDTSHGMWAAAGALHLALNPEKSDDPPVDPFVLV